MRNEDKDQTAPASESDSALRSPPSEYQTEPATSFKWVIVTGVTVWALGAAMIVWSRFFSN